jgi:hypothetical protein
MSNGPRGTGGLMAVIIDLTNTVCPVEEKFKNSKLTSL